MRAVQALHEATQSGHVLTGVIYADTGRPTFIDQLNLVDEPLATLPEERVRPSQAALNEIMEELR
jgi:2-oxoglutarate ferredoxin oxidoreductase subunit beta